ncbi:hypothetical protein [Bosea sp. CS1GBMeth4]|uniref:hypothetical protein n=1 Tax=Bosea sp. CS1GBMeth4 TaxID=1892849 RepID=UPI00164458EE|nr:hypothetical protein [Bosea sp. CS1GBMeth4]
MLKNFSLKEFLEKAQVGTASKLPWLHTTQAGHLPAILGTGRIAAMPCNVFRGEKLTYLFVGRPAYKYQLEAGETPYWLLPTVFVVRFQTDPKIKRLFPFDSGAFVNKRLPEYVTFFGRETFELAPERESIGRVVSAFFGDDQSYVKRNPRPAEKLDDEYSLTPRHAAVKAINRLYAEKSAEGFDDRAAAIELQLETDIDLTPENLLGVVMPEEYKRDREMVKIVKSITPRIEFYECHPISGNSYFSAIYSAVNTIYRKAGIRL